MSPAEILYAPPRRNRTLEAIRDVFVKAGTLKPSDKRRFFNPQEAENFKQKWHQCKTVQEFVILAKLRPQVAFVLEHDMKEFKRLGGPSFESFIIHEASGYVSQVRGILQEEGLLAGIDWREEWPVAAGRDVTAACSSRVDDLLLGYVEISKITGYILADEDQCEVYHLIPRCPWGTSSGFRP